MNAIKVFLAISAISVASWAAAAAPATYVGVQERSRRGGAQEQSGASQAVVVEGCALAHTGQMLPLDREGNFIGQSATGTGIPSAQLPQVLFNLETALAAVGSDLQQVVKLNVYVDSARTADEVRKLFVSRFRGPGHPAVSYVCTPLTYPKAQVALDAVAIVPGDGPSAVVRKRCVSIFGDKGQSDVAVLPRGDVVYVSGIPEKGELGTAAANALKGLLATIGQLGLERSQVVQVKAFLRSTREAEVVRQQVAEAFAGETPPPLVLVEWISDFPVEIEMVVAAPPAKSPSAETVTYFNPPDVKPSPVFSRVARVHGGKQIYVSGLYAGESGDAQAQVRGVFAALERIAKETGSDMRHLVKATYYITNDDEAEVITKLRQEYYDPQRPPAASKAIVKGVGMSGRSITLDMIAVPSQ